MRHLLATIVMTLSAVIVPTTLAHAQKGGWSFAVGELTRGGHVSFSAHDGPNGPSGYVVDNNANGISYDGQPMYVQGHVTCLTVVGNHAGITFQFDKSNIPELVGDGLTLYVTDNRETGQQPYFANSGLVLPPDLQSCAIWPMHYPAEGEVNVHDAGE